MLIDTHCHLADSAFAPDLPQVAERAREAGVRSALCILSADEPDEVARAATVSAAWSEVRFATGIHPHRAGAFAGRLPAAVEVLRSAMTSSDAVAVGEIGLDYHYDYAPRDVQREVFAIQLEAAAAAGRPVVIHTREAEDDTISVLRAVGADIRGVVHCFTGTIDLARKALDLGFCISMSGILTFPRSVALREVAAFVPVDRLLVETDAPYLAPVPYRGKRNEPAWVAETSRALAALRSLNRDVLERQLADNLSTLIPEMTHVPSR